MQSEQQNSLQIIKQNEQKIDFNLVEGLVTFKQNIPLLIQQKAKNNLINLYQVQKWEVDHLKFQNLQLGQILPYTVQIRCKNIDVDRNYNQIVVQAIQQISFPNLKVLTISSCFISSIQPLQKCNLPVLEELDLYWNWLTQFKSLRKIHTPNIKKININQNQSCQYNNIPELYHSQKQTMNALKLIRNKIVPNLKRKYFQTDQNKNTLVCTLLLSHFESLDFLNFQQI